MLTLPELETDNRHLLLRAISGSRAYGLDTPESDTDIKGVFVLPEADFYALNPIEQLNNPSNDVVYYEWRKFVALLHGSNPNIFHVWAYKTQEGVLGTAKKAGGAAEHDKVDERVGAEAVGAVHRHAGGFADGH